MKRILHVVGGMNVGGTETMLLNIYRNIDREKVQYDFISYYNNEGYYDKEIKELGGRVIRLTTPNLQGPLKTVKELSKVIKQYGPYEALHCHTLFNCGLAVLAGYLSGIKIRIAHAHTTADVQNSLVKKIYIAAMRMLIGLFSTNFAACSKNAALYLFGNRIIRSKRYTYIPNYIDYDKFINISNYQSIRDELNIKEYHKVVGHIGRFIDAKNHSFLIKVMANMIEKNENVRGILVGEGYLRADMMQKVNEMGLKDKIYFLGLREDIPKILKCMDLFIFPSKYEGLGLVLLEAQAVGVPCLVSEAIQPEANLKLGLVEKLNLSEGVDKWSDKAVEMFDIKHPEKEKIINQFKKSGYTLKNILSKLSNIYCVKEMEEKYEKGVSSIL